MNSQVNSIDPGSRTPAGPAEVHQFGLMFTGSDSAAAASCARWREPGPVPGLTSLRDPRAGGRLPHGCSPGDGRLTDRGPVRHEAEGALFLLCVVQPEHGVQPVEQAPEFDDVLGLHGLLPRPARSRCSWLTWCSISAWVRLIAAAASVPSSARATTEQQKVLGEEHAPYATGPSLGYR